MEAQLLKKQISYTIACVSEFARYYHITEKVSFEFLEKYGAIAFLKDCYDAEHVLSFEDAIEDMTRICTNNGGDINAIIPRQ